jgi:hypothetical protein
MIKNPTEYDILELEYWEVIYIKTAPIICTPITSGFIDEYFLAQRTGSHTVQPIKRNENGYSPNLTYKDIEEIYLEDEKPEYFI